MTNYEGMRRAFDVLTQFAHTIDVIHQGRVNGVLNDGEYVEGIGSAIVILTKELENLNQALAT